LLDLVAWMENGDCLFIQCKLTGRISKEEKDNLRDIAAIVGAKPVVASKPGRGRILLERIDGAMNVTCKSGN